ncbi:hypothetical protein [Vibrio sp. TRT 17S01]|uniref:hypothetical protein n=1 Tax=Vibrio sp. TRT 17S01 TaxID=3418505 RepID=UPI003CE6983B
MIKVAFEVSDNYSQHNHFLPLAKTLIQDVDFCVSFYTTDKEIAKTFYQSDLGTEKVIFLRDSFQSEVKKRALTILKRINFKQLTVLSQKLYGRFKVKKLESYNGFYKANLKYFNDFDYIFTTELKGCSEVKTLLKPKLVWLLHGLCANQYSLTKDWSPDILVCAQKNLDDYLAKTNYIKENSKIFDRYYLKFEAVSSLDSDDFSGFLNDNHTFVYNPHWDAKSSFASWFSHGLEILRIFKLRDDINLIFAPHINIDRYSMLGDISEFYQCNNIHIDINSHSLVNGTYFKYCDTYIGEQSSQFFEYSSFRDISAIFLNLKNISLTRELSYWSSGDVCTCIRNLENLIDFHSSGNAKLVDRNIVFKPIELNQSEALMKDIILDFYDANNIN